MILLERNLGYIQEFYLSETKEISYDISLIDNQDDNKTITIQHGNTLKFYYSYFDEDSILYYNNSIYFISKRDLRRRKISYYDVIDIGYKIKNLSNEYHIYLTPSYYLGKLVIEKYDSLYFDKTKSKLIYFNTKNKLYIIYGEIISMSDRTILVS